MKMSGKYGKEHPTLTANPESKVGKATWNFGMDHREDTALEKRPLLSFHFWSIHSSRHERGACVPLRYRICLTTKIYTSKLQWKYISMRYTQSKLSQTKSEIWRWGDSSVSKSLLCKHEDWTQSPAPMWEEGTVVACIWTPAWGGKHWSVRQIGKFNGLANLVKLMGSRLSEKCHLKK